MRTLRFTQVDVFAGRPSAGNPLAVFPARVEGTPGHITDVLVGGPVQPVLTGELTLPG